MLHGARLQMQDTEGAHGSLSSLEAHVVDKHSAESRFPIRLLVRYTPDSQWFVRSWETILASLFHALSSALFFGGGGIIVNFPRLWSSRFATIVYELEIFSLIQAIDTRCVQFSPIAWLKERISQHFTIAKDSETDKGKESITPPAPKKSFLDRASNRLARTVAQIRTGHWLFSPYLKRVRKNREEQVSDICWWCGQYRMSSTHVVLRCIHPKLEGARNDFWDRPDEDSKIRKRPTSVGQLLGT
jgi:hypothetical protein